MRGDPCIKMVIDAQPIQNARMAKKRSYSREFTPRTERRCYFMFDKVPAVLHDKVKAKAKREGVSLRALVLGWLKEWADK